MPPSPALSLQFKNVLLAGTLVGFVAGAYVYTMSAVGSQDEVGEAIRKLEQAKSQE